MANFLGYGTGFWEFNYAGKARGIVPNSVIETGVLKVAGWLVYCYFLCVGVIDGAQQCSILVTHFCETIINTM